MRMMMLVIGIILSESGAGNCAQHPNIVVIYVDDLGYGDAGCYGATSVRTPNIDRIASEGCRFTDGHSSAATCTPSRYSLLTGEYAWRLEGTGIAPGDANAIIKPGRVTIPSLLHQAGYRSAVIGKWHLGLGNGPIDWNKPISPGPLEIGFDECFLIPATGDRVPCVYVVNRDVAGLDKDDPITVSFRNRIGDEPTGLDNPELLKVKWDHGHNATIINGISRIGFMSGGKAARWVDEDMADVITTQARSFIDRHVASHSGQPFFLYFNPHDIHVPRVPHPRFVGATSMGPRGDVIAELDWTVGEILETLDQHRMTENTLVIFSSDNGPVLNDGYKDQAVEKIGDHRAAGVLRGGKYSAFEGGTRVPFLVRWPKKIAPGTTSDALMCQIDFLATFAELVGLRLPDGAGPDSLNMLPALLGTERKGRDHLVQQAGVLSLRMGPWKYIEPGKGPALNKQVNIETGIAPKPGLFQLEQDLSEERNVADQHPEQLKVMAALLARVREQGTPR
jgi:arylsulfatase A-like enzyme